MIKNLVNLKKFEFLDFKHKLLITNILSALGEIYLPKIVIMYGSFSKNEGSWDTDGITPYNDVDLIFIDKKIKKSKISLYKKKLFQKLNTRFIDISIFTKNKLSKLKPSIFSFDLFEFGLVINGELNLKRYTFNNFLITTKDIDILFRTRIWTFVGSYPKKGLENLNAKDQIFFNYQMSKSIFSIIDCLSILKKEYVSSYKDKINWANNQLEFKNYFELLKFAEKIKVNGKMNFFFTSNKKLLNQVSTLFYEIFKIGLQNHYRSNLEFSDLVRWAYGYSIKAKILKYLYFFKGINGFTTFNLILAQFYILEKTLNIDVSENEKFFLEKKLNLHSNGFHDFRIQVANKRLKP